MACVYTLHVGGGGKGFKEEERVSKERVFALIRPINRFARLAWVGLSGFGGGDTVALFGA